MDPQHHDLVELLHGKDRLKWTAYNSHNIKRFSENEIEKITSMYIRTVGQGAFGKVYAGILEDKSMVAVKKFDHKDGKMKECLAKEIIVHSQINHRNVTRLIGYCLEENALMMVTEYIPSGNLSDILHRDGRPISLDTRLRIATECAEALGYMHLQMYTQVIHGDIKPANILLDNNFNAKISDFGISRLVNTDKTLYTTRIIGSIGYIDPLFVRTGRLTPKSDVYSFGVVLLEMFTRKKMKTDNEGFSLVDGFMLALSKGFKRVREMFDAEIAGGGNTKIFEGIAKLIGECLSIEIHKRPEMKYVAEQLHVLRKAHHQGQERVGRFSWGMKNKTDSLAEKIIPAKKTDQVSGMALELELKDLLGSLFLGQGMFGRMHKVMLDSGVMLVVKRINGALQLGEQEFRRRVAVMADIQNDLVMRLRWYHYNKDEPLLAYDYMPMGSLAALLHGNNGTARGQLNWEQRSSIALTVARAVAAIHSTGPAVCHGNIKSSNVLLTSDCKARLSEHGLHTLVDMSVSCASGYHAPEVTVIAHHITKQSDVYSFGILLLELLTGKPPANMLLFQWVQSIVCKEWTTKVLDTELHKQQKSAQVEMLLLLHLAMVCCTQVANERPTISEVVQKMEEIRSFSIARWERAAAETFIPVNEIERAQNASQENTRTIVSALSTMAEPVVMGRGTFGTTWKVTTEREGVTMTLKLIKGVVDLPEAEFDRRVAAIKAIKNELIMPLHWHYFGDGVKALMYGYMPNGSLSAVLHGNGSSRLDWEQRSSIALTVARGVAAIHSGRPAACHGNIKSSNVLLTSDYEARLSEHGLHTLINMSSFVDATKESGYANVTRNIRVTQEADVYSFGILLIELLTAREPADASLRAKGMDLSRWVNSVARENWMTKVFDVELVTQQGAAAQGMEELLHLAMECCTSFDLRPKISEVVCRIEDIRRSKNPRGPFYHRRDSTNMMMRRILMEEGTVFSRGTLYHGGKERDEQNTYGDDWLDDLLWHEDVHPSMLRRRESQIS